MNWKRILLVAMLGVLALAFFTVAAVGIAATAALGTAAAVISDSGVVQAFEEVARDAERLQIEAGENYITFTDPDSGESRTIRSSDYVGSDRIGRGQVEFSLPEVTITAEESAASVVRSADGGRVEVQVPQITITGPDGEQARIVVPDVQSPNLDVDVRAPRLDLDGEHYWTYHPDAWSGAEFGLRLVGGFLRGLFTLALLVVVAAIAYVLLRNRRRAETADPIKGEDNS